MINLQLIVTSPSNDLVEWTSQNVKLKCPKDRPWYQLNAAPVQIVNVFPLPCKCGKQKIDMNRYDCDDKASVYIGQCSRCEIIVWTYRTGVASNV